MRIPDSWRPKITSSGSCVQVGSTYSISGKLLNGLTQGGAFGDDGQSATNYPLVRITNNGPGHRAFARPRDFSTMCVATGNQSVGTKFDVLSGTEMGPSALQVIANASRR